MLRYMNGKILQTAIPEETTLVIKLARSETDKAQPLNEAFPEILKEYSKHITTLCMIGGEEDQYELSELFAEVHKKGLKTGLSTYLTERAQIDMRLQNELDYLQLGRKTYKKDYCPFGDITDWVEIA